MDVQKQRRVLVMAAGLMLLAQSAVSYSLNVDISKDGWHGRRLLNSSSSVASENTEPEKSFWDKIEEFYDDKNNFAMYLVLPIIVLVYGGCCMIYCIAKCRQYVKRKKDKTKNDDKDDDDDDDIVSNNNNEFKSITEDNNVGTRAAVFTHRRPQSKASVTDVKLERESTTTPLPWQVPEEEDGLTHNSKSTEKQKLVKSNQWDVIDDTETLYLSNNDTLPRKKHAPPRPPQPQSHHRPSSEMMSPPPPYEGHERNGHKEEIFMLGASSNRYNEVNVAPVKAVNKPPYNPNPTVRLISQTTGGNPPSSKNYAMAKQAAQLLRLEDPKPKRGQPGYKKPKRLVFVAE